MRSFINISKHPEQKYLPVQCDEGVHSIVAYVILKHPTEFQFIVSMMSWFQMTKIAMHCIGKYLQVSDVEDTITLRKKCPYSELFWSVFSAFELNTERYCN